MASRDRNRGHCDSDRQVSTDSENLSVDAEEHMMNGGMCLGYRGVSSIRKRIAMQVNADHNECRLLEPSSYPCCTRPPPSDSGSSSIAVKCRSY